MARTKAVDVPLSERPNFIHGQAELMGILGVCYETLKKEYLDCGLRPWRVKGGKEYYRMQDLESFMDKYAYEPKKL